MFDPFKSNENKILGPYYKSRLQLKSNPDSKIFPVNCKFICDSTPI